MGFLLLLHGWLLWLSLCLPILETHLFSNGESLSHSKEISGEILNKYF